MKQILISIKPEWVAKILNGEKIIEIRKTKPNEDNLPCEVFIYCSKGKKDYHLCKLYKDNKDPYYTYESYKGCGLMPNPIDGKVVAKCKIFVEGRSIKGLLHSVSDFNWFLVHCGLKPFDSDSYNFFKNYVKDKEYIYTWYIDNLQIFDKPFDLRDDGFLGNPKTKLRITKAPQSWCYCEYDENNGFLPF